MALSHEDLAALHLLVEELVARNGLALSVQQLDTTMKELVATVRRESPPSLAMAVGLARRHGMSVEDLVREAKAPLIDTRSEAIRIATLDGLHPSAIARVRAREAPPPQRHICEWLLDIWDLHVELVTPVPKPRREGSPPPPLRLRSRRDSDGSPGQAVAPDVPDVPRKLSLLEFASLSMGLALRSETPDEVYAHFGLLDVETRTQELAAWEEHFSKHPEDRPSGPTQERFRAQWSREPPPRAAESPSAPRPVAAALPYKPALALDAYARCTVELRSRPEDEAGVWTFFGIDRSEWERTSSFWRERLSDNVELAAEWEHMCREHDAALQRHSAAPVPIEYARSVGPSSLVDREHMALEQYALYVVELERSTDKDAVHRRHGVAEARAREALEAHYKALFERDANAYARWASLVAETREGWMDF